MATWSDLTEYVRREFEVIRDVPDELRILMRYRVEDAPERVQMIVLAREVLDGKEDWVQIATPIASFKDVDVRAVLEEIGSAVVVGAACIMGEHLVLRHSLPLINLDINEFLDPLELVALQGDELEERFTGRDDY
jgi:hypothetical protein